MKRPLMSIKGLSVSPDELRAAVSEVSAIWLQCQRKPKVAAPKRKHRALTAEEREAKARATAQARRQRADEREARELERLLARIGYLSRRTEREAEAMLRVRVSWKPGPSSVCPRALYSRLHPEISARTAKALTRSRVAADGFRNIVLRKIPRGYGRKASATREYRIGEAADLARYILREDGLEEGIAACLSNVLVTEGEHALYESETFSLDSRRCAQIVGFWNALEAFEAEADADGNVFFHIILAMPHELSPAGRAGALEDFCLQLDALHLPFVAALHRPDPTGDARNFHAHIMIAPRPFSVEGPFAWSFEAGKATEFNLPAGIGWLRQQAAKAFNDALTREHSSVRYSDLSQAKRGVPATGEVHDGPVLTKRKAQEDQDERHGFARNLTAHVARAVQRQVALGGRIDDIKGQLEVAPAARPPSASPQPQQLEALRARFPNPHRLKGLSADCFETFTPTDWAADHWYAPAFNLMVELRRGRDGVVADRNGEPQLLEENLEPAYRALLKAPALPDIVQEALVEAHRRIVIEQERKKRVAREKEHIRQQRLAQLQKEPILLFAGRLDLLPEYREFFPPEVIALNGVREAMLACHTAALQAQNRPIAEEDAANIHRSGTGTGAGVAEQGAEPIREAQTAAQPDLATGAGGELHQAAAKTPAPPEKDDDDDWNLLLQGYAGKVAQTGKGNTGR